VAARFRSDLGVGITGIAGPDGGTEDKPVGLVFISVWSDGDGGGHRLTRRMVLPGTRADIRDRSVTVSMHMLRRTLLGEPAQARPPARGDEATARRT
jgi:nicotinamide-nucleotide amidase